MVSISNVNKIVEALAKTLGKNFFLKETFPLNQYIV